MDNYQRGTYCSDPATDGGRGDAAGGGLTFTLGGAAGDGADGGDVEDIQRARGRGKESYLYLLTYTLGY